jgi:hypothetical protein
MHKYMLPLLIMFCFYFWSCSLPSSFLRASVHPWVMGNSTIRCCTDNLFMSRGCVHEHDNETIGGWVRLVSYNHHHAQGDRQLGKPGWPRLLPRLTAIKETLTKIPRGGTTSGTAGCLSAGRLRLAISLMMTRMIAHRSNCRNTWWAAWTTYNNKLLVAVLKDVHEVAKGDT